MIVADLHAHTIASDGTYLSAELIEKAEERGLEAIALTDHDTVAGVQEGLDRASDSSVQLIPGVEISSEFEGRDVHILGLWIDHNSKGLVDILDSFKKKRIKRAEMILERIIDRGFDMEMSDLLAISGEGSLGRSHIARAMMGKGYVGTVSEAFDLYLMRGAPCFVEKNLVAPGDALALLKEAGAIVSVAHPGLSQVDPFLNDLMANGLDAIEAYHPDHSEAQVRKYLTLAREEGLAVTGGSDCHGFASTRGDNLGSYGIRAGELAELHCLRSTKPRMPSDKGARK